MQNDDTKAGPRSVELKGMPTPPDFPDDVDDMSTEDWTEAEAWMAKRRAWFAAKPAEPKAVS